MVFSSTLKKPFLFLSLVSVMLSFPQCMKEESTAPVGQGWTSTDPISIPFRQRLIYAERGNLVKNPSFEQGRLINLDSNTVTYNISGWKTFGENLTWIMHSPDSNGRGEEIRSGSYAIRIHRNRIDEFSNEGDGIVSDFIRVIPGNYEFSFWIRLHDIRPNPARKGDRLDDAVDVRLLFYDKNRLLISGNTYDQAGKAFIDRTFKSLAFSNFWNIDSLGWTRMVGRTTTDYFIDGDIPDEAKYVKLYFGLKGTGTMWLDDVSFRYTRNNFTAMERSGRMFDTTCTELDLVIPHPKQASLLEPLLYHSPGSDTIPMPLILLPPSPEKQTQAAAFLLKSRIESILARRYGKDSLPAIRIIRGYQDPDIEDGGLVFRFGIPDRFREVRDLGPEGYIIQPDSLHPNLVFLCGASPAADYYAAATAVQLLDDSLFVYHQARIVDFPDIPERAFLVSPVTAASNPIDYSPQLSQMAGFKLNRAYLDFYRSRTLWQQESQAYLDGLRIIGRESRESGMVELAQMVNPYAYLPVHEMIDSLDMDARERWSHAGYKSRIQLLDYYKAGIQAGATTLVLCSHDYLPTSSWGNYVLYALEDEDEYINLQAAHLDLIMTLHSWIRERYPGISLEFIPPWYSNEQLDASRGQAEQYFHDLQPKIPDDLKIMWSGPARQSSEVNALDLKRFHELAGRETVLLDNSMNRLTRILGDTAMILQYPMKLRTLNLFDPFDVQFSAPYIMSDDVRKLLINTPISTEIMKIRMATAADFMWNMESYDPDLSIWKTLVSRFGNSTSLELYRFNDAYFTTLASISALKHGKDQQRLVRQVSDHMALMEKSLGRLDRMLSADPALLNELKKLKQDLERLYDKEIKHVASQITAAMESM